MAPRLQLLGSPRADGAGTAATDRDLPLDKPASLLYYLAQRGDWVGRSELGFLYRPDAPETVALANVRVLLYRAKERFWADGIEIEKFRVRFRADTDVRAFAAALEQGAWERALELYRGPFLDGLQVADSPGYQTWLELERSDLEQKWRLAALEHARAANARGDHATAQRWLERLRDADPLDEEALQEYVRALAAAGKRKQAMDAYEAFRALLQRELEVEPLEATRVLRDSLERGALEPEQATAPRARHNLPAPTTRFIGRRRELEQLLATLANDDCRLLTITGLGGVGKTQLALEAARQQLERFADGVWLVPLAGVGAPELLVASIAGATQLRFAGAGDPQRQLLDYLRDKEMLLVLDNFEHLVEGAPLLEELLRAAPRLKLLVTSRLALRLRAEWLFDLAGLAYPPTGGQEVPDTAKNYDAVKLFVARAERLSGTFVAEGGTLAGIVELCRLVEGLPLALELAAVWTRSLSVRQLLDELQRNLDLLTSPLRDIPERHRSLRTVFDYSWQRLTAKEQQALAQLAVFPAGFTLAAAEAVAGVHLAMLMSLINHSLVRRSRSGRYHLHELIRQYAHGRLPAAEQQELARRFSGYYLELLAGLEPEIRGARHLPVMEQLLQEADSLRAAVDLALADEAWPLLDGALPGLYLFFREAGLLLEGLALCQRLLEALPSPTEAAAATPLEERLRARCQLRFGSFLRHLGRYQEAKDALERAVTELRPLALPAELVQALSVLTTAARESGDPERAEAAITEAVTLRDGLDEPTSRAMTSFSLALLRRDQGRYPEAREALEHCLEQYEQLGDLVGCALATAQLALLAYEGQDGSATPKRHTQRALELFRQTGQKKNEAVALNNLASIAFREGDAEAGERLLRQSLEIKRHLGDVGGQLTALANLGAIARGRGGYPEAEAYLTQSLELAERHGLRAGQLYTLAELGETARQAGKPDKARAFFRAMLGFADLTQLPASRSFAGLWYVAALHQQAGAAEEAFLLASFLLHDARTPRQLKQYATEALAQLGNELAPETIAELEPQATAADLEEMVARQRDLFGVDTLAAPPEIQRSQR